MRLRRQLALYVLGYAALIGFILLLAATGGYAQKADPGRETPKAISELDVLRLGKLYAERQLFEQALLKLSAQQEALRVQTQLTRRDQDVKNAELNAAIVAAGADVGLTADDIRAGWTPDLDKRIWVKAEATR
jgi:hypothetical protein